MAELHSEPWLCFLIDDGDPEPRCGKGEGSTEGLERPWEECLSDALTRGWAEDRSGTCFVISLLLR